ncbi:type II secretion system secretin GspD [Endozoicomonas ascidiicola]|uniref:type II secretion system secretin GspD n=1 Tax=Endozoicomonas ascidiicola TaxID=1698521 RepID=UPI00083393EF|nr:type II secretion system secretin GspD [Endozoicomonas ascidiicola]
MKRFVSLVVVLSLFSQPVLAENKVDVEAHKQHPAAEKTPADAPLKNDIKIKLKNSDIRSFIDWIAAETDRNLIVDPRVKGKVTVVVNEPLNREEAWNVFKEVLALHGFSVLEDGQTFKVLPSNLVRHSAPPYKNGQVGNSVDPTIRILKTRFINAAQIIPVIKSLVPQTGHVAALPDSNLLLVVAEDRIVARLEQVVAQLDQYVDAELYVVRLQYADARETITTMTAIAGKGQAGQLPSQQVLMAADERTNSIILAGPASRLGRWKTLLSALDQEEVIEDESHVIYLDFMKAKEAADILKDISASMLKRDKNRAGDELQIAIRASESTNAVVISAPPAYIQALQKIIKKLDIRRAQVLVEAIIVEIAETDLNELGVQWGTSGSALNGDGWYGGSKLGAGGLIGLDGFASGEDSIIGRGLNLGFYRNSSLRTLVQAFSGNDAINILSTPSLIALDNEGGKIVVGENVPFITGQSTGSSSSTDNPFQTIERKDVGLQLKVTPQINQGELMTLDIYQEISSVTDDSKASDIVTRTRSIETKVQAQSGSIIVLGGLISDEITSSEQKVPLLGDIPILGHLFRSNSQDRKRKNLMVFIRPTILRTQEDALSITGGKYSYIREQQQAFQPLQSDWLTNDDDKPLLPAYPEPKPAVDSKAVKERYHQIRAGGQR